MISRGMMNRQLYANGPGIMGLQAETTGPFEPQQDNSNVEQMVQEAINVLTNNLKVPVDTAFKYVVSVLKEIPPDAIKTGGTKFIVERAVEKVRSGEKPAQVAPQIEDLLQGQQPTADDVSVMEDLEERQRIMREKGMIDEDDQNYAGGGIVSLRQNYGLGSIAKSFTKGVKGIVKGATKAVKSIASSDIGKLAILAAGGYYLGGGAMFGGPGFSFGQLGTSLAKPFTGIKSLFTQGAPSNFLTKASGYGVDAVIPGASIPQTFLGSVGSTLSKAGSVMKSPLFTTAAILAPSILAGATADDESPEEALAKSKAMREAEVKAQYDPIRERLGPSYDYQTGTYRAANGGIMRTKYAMGSDMPMGNPRVNQAGTPELDYRQEGGFVPPIGIKEKEDDIPAMLSNNEFVMTAEAVGGADPLGRGDRNRGAEAMYALMKKLENKGAMA